MINSSELRKIQEKILPIVANREILLYIHTEHQFYYCQSLL